MIDASATKNAFREAYRDRLPVDHQAPLNDRGQSNVPPYSRRPLSTQRRVQRPQPRILSIALLAAVTVVSMATYYVITGIAAEKLSPLTIATTQRIVGGLLLVVVGLLPGPFQRIRTRLQVSPEQSRWLVVLSLTNVPLLGCIVGGFAYSTATNAALLERLDLPAALLLGRIFLSERARWADWILMLPLTAGVLLVLEVWPGQWGMHLVGDLMFVAATMLAVGNAILIRCHLANVSPWTIARWNLGLSAVWFTLLHLAFEGWGTLLELWGLPGMAGILAVLGFLALVELTSYYGLLQRLNIWYVRCVLLFIPIVTAAVEHFRRETPLGLGQWAGVVLVVSSLLVLVAGRLSNRSESGRSDQPAEECRTTFATIRACPCAVAKEVV